MSIFFNQVCCDFISNLVATKLLIKSQQTWLKKIDIDTHLECSDTKIKDKLSATIDTYLRRHSI